MNDTIRNKHIIIDEDTYCKFGGAKVPGGDKGLGERLKASKSKVKNGI